MVFIQVVDFSTGRIVQTAQVERPEVRGIRVEVQPGAVRAVHTHDDVRFHLWIPTSGNTTAQVMEVFVK